MRVDGEAEEVGVEVVQLLPGVVVALVTVVSSSDGIGGGVW